MLKVREASNEQLKCVYIARVLRRAVIRSFQVAANVSSEYML